MRPSRHIAAALLGLVAGACTPPQGREVLDCPSQELFTTSVAPYLERRCGTLDCHGSPARPMRLYGQYGLRHPDEANWSGGFATTHREREENYLAVCGVEPARDDAGTPLVLRKAHGEGHKGGTIVGPSSPEEECLAGWFRGDQDLGEVCDKAIDHLSPH